MKLSIQTDSLHDLKTFDDKWLMRLDNDKFLTLFFFVYKGLEPVAASSEEEEQQRCERRSMSFVNAPGDERGTEFSHIQNPEEQEKLEAVTTPRKKKKGKKGSNPSTGTKKKRKRKRASPKKSGNPDEEKSNEEVMSKLMAVKQLQQQPMLIGKAIF